MADEGVKPMSRVEAGTHFLQMMSEKAIEKAIEKAFANSESTSLIVPPRSVKWLGTDRRQHRMTRLFSLEVIGPTESAVGLTRHVPVCSN